MSTRSWYHPWWPSHGSVECLSTAPIMAMRIVGPSTRKPQKMNAWARPGPMRWRSLRCPSTITSSFSTRLGISAVRSTGLPARTSPTSVITLRVNRVPLRISATASAIAPMTTLLSVLDSADLGRDRRDDLVQVADHGIVGAREDRGLGVGVDREQALGALAARHVLGGTADAAGDVDLGRDLRARLPDLVRVGTPARHRDRARAADGGAQQLGQLLDHREALGRADPPAARHDDIRVGQRHACACGAHTL